MEKVVKIVNKKDDTNEINVLFMGLMGERKGVYDIIEAAKYIQNPYAPEIFNLLP